jgi:hypothetical protein
VNIGLSVVVHVDVVRLEGFGHVDDTRVQYLVMLKLWTCEC